ncbi:DUF2793 domain-containing protein [Marimonas arenosa]|uniref:DUF2793 domain-containing protein n=1 Tax=Marimonas arenosa TaxID=1795305 RepID=A0AAE3WBB4_9RHOB|nr:DUF2793 domain-containing protein [Marimonas arenosa]MDQ2090061.1 DUF2793 domain-containing protein [Marimonas arenosa]
MPERSPNLDLPYLQPSQAQKHVTHNEALQALDALAQFVAIELGATTPPTTPAIGDCWGLGTGATGAWAGHDGDIALAIESGWVFLTPREGWRVWDRTAGVLMVFRNNGWASPTFAQLGVNATPDATNRLSIGADATLLSHDGAGHQLKVNKATATDTASLLFQSGWTGHAEVGLAGSNGWSVKVSPDGSTWTDALAVDNATGFVGIGGTAPDTPLHVQRSDGTAAIKIEETSTAASARTVATFINNGRPDFVLGNSSTGLEWSFGGGTNLVFKSGSLGSPPSAKATQATFESASGNLVLAGAVQVAGYTVATLPAASAMPWAIIGVSDETGGAVLAFSDGSDWRRVTDRAVVS